ncbi:PREDICTED: taste receptor type 2 member 39-like [Nanorana parkeri]|uniref:taste receptor type 2 member 39-like n=1 Tax=Nanorana parkeri TaxID=125878 RepID=UPI000854A6B0|nr:PREDICTED: taste receptor type 2 member 39-like [Nanorana parkeri]
MLSPTTVISLGVLTLEAITGLCSNFFIIISLIISAYNEKYFAPYSRILIALCVSNVGYTLLMSANIVIGFVHPLLSSAPFAMYIVNYMTLFSIISSTWLTCCLCFFYFIKIVQFQPGFLAWVKMKIETILPWMILTVELISLSESFLALLVYDQESANNSTMSMDEMTSEPHKLILNFTILALILFSLPLSVSILSMAVSAWFLKQHSGHIERNVKVSKAGAKDYQSAVRTMSCLILFYALMYLVTLLLGLPVFDSQSWGYWMCVMGLFSFALVQSSLLISGNPKLKAAWRQMFTCK